MFGTSKSNFVSHFSVKTSLTSFNSYPTQDNLQSINLAIKFKTTYTITVTGIDHSRIASYKR